mmetsp:Transcript_92824/g.199079  ORF Transcript_92824/g.199079 Transcript_92824/m.199079 type:complete len:258 (-) Transcript_92824:1037-1810(-)
MQTQIFSAKSLSVRQFQQSGKVNAMMMEQVALGLAKQGITPEVVEYVVEMRALVNQSLLKISEDHVLDLSMLSASYSNLVELEEQFRKDNATATSRGEVVAEKRSNHIDCRIDAARCESEVRLADTRLQEKKTLLEGAHDELVHDFDAKFGDYHDIHVGYSFRTKGASDALNYKSAHDAYQSAWDAWNATQHQCARKLASCDATQGSLVSQVCSFADAIHEAVTNYQRGYDMQRSEYEKFISITKLKVADRKGSHTR